MICCKNVVDVASLFLEGNSNLVCECKVDFLSLLCVLLLYECALPHHLGGNQLPSGHKSKKLANLVIT